MKKPELITITDTNNKLLIRLIEYIPKESNLSFIIKTCNKGQANNLINDSDLKKAKFKVVPVVDGQEIESKCLYINSKNDIIEVKDNTLIVTETKDTIKNEDKQFVDNSSIIEPEKKYRLEELKYKSMFENSPIGNSITSHDGKLSVNSKFSEIVGYTEEELNGMNWKEITHPEDIQGSIDAINNMLSSGEPVKFRKRYT